MLNEQESTQIKNTLGLMREPVRLALFVSDAGCEGCPDAITIARAIKAASARIALELFDITMDRDKSDLYGITLTPSFVIQGEDGRIVTFSGVVGGEVLEALIDCIVAVSTNRVWFPDHVRSTLKLLERDVLIQVFVENDCSACRPVAETAIGLARESSLIHTNIIVAPDFPDVMKKYGMSALPKTVFGGNLHLDGHVTESTFLEMIFAAEGVKGSAEKHCLVCGGASSDSICTMCKTKIQAESLDHKLREEKLKIREAPKKKNGA